MAAVFVFVLLYAVVHVVSPFDLVNFLIDMDDVCVGDGCVCAATQSVYDELGMLSEMRHAELELLDLKFLDVVSVLKRDMDALGRDIDRLAGRLMELHREYDRHVADHVEGRKAVCTTYSSEMGRRRVYTSLSRGDVVFML